MIETEKVKIAKIILRKTGIDRMLDNIIEHCASISYDDYEQINNINFDSHDKNGSVKFLNNDCIIGQYTCLDYDEIKNCLKYFQDGFDSKCNYFFKSDGSIRLKFVINIEKIKQKGDFFNIFLDIYFPKFSDHKVYILSAYTLATDNAEDEISSTLFWLSLNQ